MQCRTLCPICEEGEVYGTVRSGHLGSGEIEITVEDVDERCSLGCAIATEQTYNQVVDGLIEDFDDAWRA